MILTHIIKQGCCFATIHTQALLILCHGIQFGTILYRSDIIIGCKYLRLLRCIHLVIKNLSSRKCLWGTLDHHLTTTVLLPCKMSKKSVVTTNNRLFLVLAATVQGQQNLRFSVGLYCHVVVLRPGRPEVRILPVALKKRIAMYFCNAFLL